jgi:transposase
LIFTDEASFRQDSTLHATWSRVGHPPEVPVTGERKNVKILGAIELWRTRFHYREDTIFNASSYLTFLEQLARSYRRQGAILIQDNASYHKDAEVWSWFRSNRHWLEVHQLPPYSPEFNPTERLWQHTRRTGTHNRYFASRAELETTLTRVFGEMQCHPAIIRSYLRPFCWSLCPFNYARLYSSPGWRARASASELSRLAARQENRENQEANPARCYCRVSRSSTAVSP